MYIITLHVLCKCEMKSDEDIMTKTILSISMDTRHNYLKILFGKKSDKL